MLLRFFMACLALLLLPLSAQAQWAQNYLIINYAEFEQNVSSGGTTLKVEGDGRSFGYGLIVSEFVDFEAVFSEYEYDTFQFKGERVHGEEVSTFEAITYFKSPLSYRFVPFAMVGLVLVSSDIEEADEAFEPYIGAGLDILLNENFDIRISFRPYGGDIDADLYTIGPKIRF